MVEDGILVPSAHGYRLSKNIFDEYRKNPNNVKLKIRDEYIDYTVEPTVNKNNNATTNRTEDNRIEYRLVKEPEKTGEEDEILSLKPKLGSDNLAVDIITVIAFNLMGDRFYRDEKGKLRRNVDLPSWMSISDIIENLKESWVFID
jgi:hypothetical protein